MGKVTAGECIFAVHGFLGSRWEFLVLRHYLVSLGYDMVTWGHGSVTRPTREYAAQLASRVKEVFDARSPRRVHLLGHSMGGIVVRGALSRLECTIPQSARGRVVLLATPNRGSPAAELMSRVLGGIVPAFSDLSSDKSSYANGLPGKCGWEIGTIWTPYDHLVPPSSASPEWSSATVQVSGLHSTILLRPEVARLVGSYIATGSFRPPDAPGSADFAVSLPVHLRRLLGRALL